MSGSSSPPRRPFVILNPAAGRGRPSRRMGRYVRLLRDELGDFEHRLTTRPGEEAQLADDALKGGADRIIAAGGDGTWSNVADRIVSSGRRDVTFGLLPMGTGNDFAKGLGISHAKPEEAVAVAAGRSVVDVDVGMGTFSGPAGSSSRSFLLVAGFGLDSAVLEDIEGARFLPGDVVYVLAALRQIFRFGSISLGFSRDGGESVHDDLLMLALCNGSSIGGSFRVAPSASLTDGKLNACAVRDGSIRERISVLRRARKGTHGVSPLVDLFEFGTLAVDFDVPTRYQIDGELQDDPIERARIEVAPAALRVAAPSRRSGG